MNRVKYFFLKKAEINWILTVILLVAYPILLTVITLLIQPNGIMNLVEMSTDTNTLMPLLNFLPIFFSMLLLFFASSRLVLSACVVTPIFILLSVINRMKILYRDNPLFSWDISSAREALIIFDNMTALIAALVVLFVLYVALSAILSIKIKNKKLPWTARIAGTLICVFFIWWGNINIYSSSDIFDYLYTYIQGSIYKETDKCNSMGIVYFFIYTHNTNQLSAPDGYDEAEVTDTINALESEEVWNSAEDTEALDSVKKPHIIMIMGEAFSALSENESFDFEGYQDPLENFKALCEEGLSGKIIVPDKGGGTVNTEFDVLTGLATRYLRGVSDSYRIVNKKFEAIPSLLSKFGYASAALHPGDPWFYDRQNVYEYLGFEAMYFRENFEQEYKGNQLSERVTIDKLISVFEDHLEENPDIPLFEFCVTIQNHGTYKNKYFSEGTNFQTTLSLTDDETNMLANYFAGVIDVDNELRRLTDYLESTDEPVVLVYFGDHYPLRGTGLFSLLFETDAEAGSYEDLSNIADIPYLIWQNPAAENITQISANAQTTEMPEAEGMGISSNFLGAYLLELLGYDSISAYFDYTNEMRTIFPVIFEGVAFMSDGTPSYNADNDSIEALRLYRNWMFYTVNN